MLRLKRKASHILVYAISLAAALSLVDLIKSLSAKYFKTHKTVKYQVLITLGLLTMAILLSWQLIKTSYVVEGRDSGRGAGGDRYYLGKREFRSFDGPNPGSDNFQQPEEFADENGHSFMGCSCDDCDVNRDEELQKMREAN